MPLAALGGPCLGTGLLREGMVVIQAHEIYVQGASLGLFRSAWQRSLYNVERLQSWPWWTLEQTRGAAEHFEVCSAFSHPHHRHHHSYNNLPHVSQGPDLQKFLGEILSLS